jgi:ribosomal protein S12 methylthiotransferase
MPKRYFLDPFGCVKNQVDAENMMAYLDNAGWTAVQDAADADLIIVNSCGFIQSAKQESINAVLSWRRLYPQKKIILAGCLAQRYTKELAESLPEADALFGIEDISKITWVCRSLFDPEDGNNSSSNESPDYFTRRYKDAEICGPSGNGVLTSAPPRLRGSNLDFFPSSRPLLSLPGSAYVKISEGCDNRCAFCAIPLIRGGLVCRTVPDILQECRGLLARGIRELCVIGQDIGSYRSNGRGLPGLLEEISGLAGNFWVRLLYIHPDNFPLPILDIMERDRRILPYFDIPFQHASAKILAAMNRRGTAGSYLSLVETIRRLPGSVIRSTFLLGFPGETEKDFAALLDFQEKARLDWLGCFCYSREEDTPAWSMPGQVPKKTALQRKTLGEERQLQITGKNMDRFKGLNLDALIEAPFKTEKQFKRKKPPDLTAALRDEPLWLGRLYCQAPEVDGVTLIKGAKSLKPGDLVPCKITSRRGFDLAGETAAGI